MAAMTASTLPERIVEAQPGLDRGRGPAGRQPARCPGRAPVARRGRQVDRTRPAPRRTAARPARQWCACRAARGAASLGLQRGQVRTDRAPGTPPFRPRAPRAPRLVQRCAPRPRPRICHCRIQSVVGATVARLHTAGARASRHRAYSRPRRSRKTQPSSAGSTAGLTRCSAATSARARRRCGPGRAASTIASGHSGTTSRNGRPGRTPAASASGEHSCTTLRSPGAPPRTSGRPSQAGWRSTSTRNGSWAIHTQATRRTWSIIE